MFSYAPIIQKLPSALFEEMGLSLDILRLDLMHKNVSGNKWFKLKFNLEKAQQHNYKSVLTFGGAFSNHIVATAAACQKANLNSIGVIRGEKNDAANPSLTFAASQGMHLHYVDRQTYAGKNSQEFKKQLAILFGPTYNIPEGGNNTEGVLGCMEILEPHWQYDYVCCAVGTGTTFAGLVASASTSQKILGVSVLKGENVLPSQTSNVLNTLFPLNKFEIAGNEAIKKIVLEDHCITNNYCFKGYAKYDSVLMAFKKEFENDFHITLDHIYTTKLFYAIYDLMKKSKFKKAARLLAIHTGGIQGNTGFERRYKLV